ncbi:MAG: ATP-binding protein, partial [Propionivibrio sp.]
LFGKLDLGSPDSQMLVDGVVLTPAQMPLQRAAAAGEISTDLELEIRLAGRPPNFVLCNAVPLLDETGRPRGAIIAALDITARKAAEARLIDAEQQLRESQRLVDLAQESGQVGFFHYRVDNDMLAWTPGQAKLFGFGEDSEREAEALAEWAQHIDPADWQRVVRHLREAVAQRQESTIVDYRVNLPGGAGAAEVAEVNEVNEVHSRWLSSRLRLIYGADDKSHEMIGITVDLTEQKRAEIERDALIVREQAARVEAETANRAKDEFLAMLGHELRNPLSAISSGVEVLQRVDAGTDVAENARRIVARQPRHLARMLDDLLDVARVLAGRVVPERQPLELAALVRRVVATIEITEAAHAHELVIEADEIWVEASATRFEQVVSNLVGNAVKYTPAGGRIVVCVSRDGDDALLQVRDNGVGIEPELLPRVFDLFVQGDRSLDRRSGGLGIGLTLVRRLVELHGGRVSAENTENGSGTVISVRLPAIAKPSAKMAATRLLPARPRRIAIIEDNEDVLEGLATMLKLAGHTVLTALEGVSGLAIILGSRPDVAIVDIGLPGMSGYDVARHSRAGGYPGQMIALTGYGQDQDQRQALAAGFDTHVLKPVSSDELLRIIVGA